MCVCVCGGVTGGRGGGQGSVFLAAPGPGKALSPLPEPSSPREMAPSLLLRLFFFFASLCLPCCMTAFSSCCRQGDSLVAVLAALT